ncbi:MAG TPA: hypothetical protein VF815_46170 [Myxococcaceae bacterium]
MASRPKDPSRPGGNRGHREEDVFSRQRALYALPLDEFTSARNALAQEFKAKGQGQEAQATRQLKRPVVTAWVVNQLAHRTPEKIEALLNAARNLETAHRKALSGFGPQALKDANRAFQQSLDDLMTEAHKTMETEGRAITSELFRQAEETLRAAALGTAEDRAILSQGMLTQPLQQTGLGAFSPLTLIGPSARARPESRVQERPSNRRPALPRVEAAPPPAARSAVVLKGPWEPRKEEAPPPPEFPSKRQLREDEAAEAKRKRTEQLHQRRREAEQQALETQARLKRTAELQQRRREARQQAEAAEKAQRVASLEVSRAQAFLKSAEEKARRMREAFEQAEAARQERAEAAERARTQAQSAEQALAQAMSELQQIEASLAEP